MHDNNTCAFQFNSCPSLIVKNLTDSVAFALSCLSIQTNLSSSATRFLLRLQSSVKSYYKGNTRIRTFGRIAGMIHPLRYTECSERFLRRFWRCIIDLQDSTPLLKLEYSKASFNKDAASRLGRWMESDRAVESRCAVVAAMATFQRFIFELPGYKLRPSENELLGAFMPAVVKATPGTLLPLKDLEKLGTHSESEQGVDMKDPTLSLDLVSEIMLDLFVKLVREWEEAFSSMWIGHQENWDW